VLRDRGLIVWFAKLWCAGFALWPILQIAEAYIQPISRRACNPPYIIWMLALYVGMACMDSLIVFSSALFSSMQVGLTKTYPSSGRLQFYPQTAGGYQQEGTPPLPHESGTESDNVEEDVKHHGAGVSALQPLSKNMLLIFLLANLMTGGVNLMVNTLACKAWVARGIISMYTALLIRVALASAPRTA
jgi:hypothetical protein